VKRAEGAAHRVATHERLRRSGKSAAGVQVVVVDESPSQVVAPTLAVPVEQITAVETLAHAIKNHWYSTATPEQKSFAGALLDVVAGIHAACSDVTTAGHRRVSLKIGHDVPQNWQRLLFDCIRQVGVDRLLHPEALTLVTKAAAGELVSLEIVTDLTRADRLKHFVFASWRPGIPADAAVVMLDATGNADDIAAVIGRPVTDCTPDGHLPTIHPVVQIPDDISRRTSSDAVAGMVEAFLAAHPDVQQLGIIGHRHHVTDLIDGGLLGAAARARVSKWCYFGQGPDRASNDWHRECDHLLRLGTPRANPGEYRRWLVQHGLHDAAGKVDGDWSAMNWESVTVDGQPIIVAGCGYRDADWHRAYTAVSRAAAQQADGRARAGLPEGIPVTVLSNDPTGYPVAPRLVPEPAAARETAEIVRGLVSQQPLPLDPESAKSPIRIPYSGFCASGAVRTRDALPTIMAAAGIDSRAAQVRLRQCVDRGLLTQPARGWYALPGTQVTVPVSSPTPARASVPEPITTIITPAASPGVVVSAAPPQHPDLAVEVVSASSSPHVATLADTTQPVGPLPPDDVLELVEERAAIMEHDGGLDRETADRLAREMIVGRDAAVFPDGAPETITAGVDVTGLHARTVPYVGAVLQRFPGTVRVLTDRDDPFALIRTRSRPRPPGVCQCGHDRWVKVPIHGGKSVRVDCGHCDSFGWFAVWHGQRCPSPFDESPAAAPEPPAKHQRMSYGFLPVPPSDLPMPVAV